MITKTLLTKSMKACFSLIAFAAGLGLSVKTQAHEDLHFSHPLIAESPSPDTKVRLNYEFFDVDEGGDADDGGEKFKEHSVSFEGEYAFSPSFSIEVGVPFSIVDPDDATSMDHLGSIEVAFKFANFAFSDHGILLGYGIEFGLPTGDEESGIGNDHLVEIEPFFNIGYQRDALEVVAFTSFGIPINQDQGEEVENEMGYNLSFLYHVSGRVSGLLEFDGETVLSGEEDGHTVINITPGIKVKPTDNDNFELGAGVSFPLTDKREFDVRAIVSAFYHF